MGSASLQEDGAERLEDADLLDRWNFDKAAWQEDASAFLHTCSQVEIPAYLERSRSGRGAHVWIFFQQATTASLARKLGAAMLTRTMERRHQIGLDSYDRLFPNQDTMPQGGFGNLIAPPLQRVPRNVGNSVRHLVLPRPTAFRLPIQAEKPPIHEIYDALTRDESRNALIVQDVLNAVRRGRSPLILTERIDHLDILAARLDLRSKTLSSFVVAWERNNAGLL